MNRKVLFFAVLLASGIALPACTRVPNPSTDGAEEGRPSAPNAESKSFPVAHTPIATSVDASLSKGSGTNLPPVIVHKSPSCGCCALWVDHMRAAGFHVEVRDTDNLNPIKERVGVPVGKGSCHTAEVGGYFVEGHVPADDIKRLLAQKPDAKGLVLPGMPMGSPGMEVPDGTTQPYTVELVARDGSTRAFATSAKQP